KVWLDAEGNVIKDTKGLVAKFGFAYEIGANKGNKTLSPGKIGVPAGTYAISELLAQLSLNYSLIGVSGAGFSINGDVAEITITNDMALAGGKYTATFTNKEDPYAIILKEWVDGNPDDLTALFDIYEYDEDAADLRGDLVKSDVAAMEKTYVAPGVYVVAEQVKPGYAIQPDQIVEIEAGGIGTVEFVNEPDDGGFDGWLLLAKTVNGTAIGDWELNGVSLADVIDDISFNLFEATLDADGNPDGYEGLAIATAELALGGDILFENLPDGLNGWYAVVEAFTPGSLAEEIFEDVGPLFVFFVDGVGVGGTKADFDYDAYYTIVNGYGGGYVLGYPGLNNTGDIFPIDVMNAETGIVYPSFCANAGSVSFFEGPGNYMVAMSEAPNGVPYAEFLKAYNYIEAKYGKLDDCRVVTQIVTWALLGAVDIPSEEFDNINWDAVEAGTWAVKGIPGAKAIVEDIMANYADYVFDGTEEIVDVVFMIGINNADYYTAQPQLVPIYGSNGFDNKTGGGYDSSVWFNKVKYGGVLEVLPGEFAFELFKITAEGEVPIGTYETGFSGMVFVEGLLPGSYVFREVTALFWDEPYHGADGDYNLVWKPIYPGTDDGLYFTIDAKGDAVWPAEYELDETGAPTVNNVAHCKHCVFWNDLEFYYGTNPHTAVPFEGGWLIYFDDFCGGELEVIGVLHPTCEAAGIVWLKCTDCEIGTGVGFGEPHGHDYQPTGEYVSGDPANGEWYICSYDKYHEIIVMPE
ncbi:MAG: hypothetical protein FWG42_09345, partial [Clostridiales bacterium]|nr:hypothetical protein [Clostridiales bacterium]